MTLLKYLSELCFVWKAGELEEMKQPTFLSLQSVMSCPPSCLCLSSVVSSLSLSAASPLLSTLSPLAAQQHSEHITVWSKKGETRSCFEHEPLLVRCHRSRESLLQNPPVHSYLITPITKVGLTLCLWTSQTAPRSRHKAPFQWQLISSSNSCRS